MDAAINCWNDKYHFDFWRPWEAIRQADLDDNHRKPGSGRVCTSVPPMGRGRLLGRNVADHKANHYFQPVD